MPRQLPRTDLRAATSRAAVSLDLDEAQGSDLALVAAWLTRLHLLHGVPFNYLVPDERMLPVESLRFFRVDANWMDALLDGAYSPGFAGVSAPMAEAARPQVLARARAATPAIREATLAKSRSLAAATPPTSLAVDGASGAPGVVSGFLLRSAVVSGWPGIEVRGFADTGGTERLLMLRLEAIAPSLLLCLFAGDVALLQLREPAEALHFGVEAATGGGWQTALRYAAGSGTGQFTGTSVPVPMRSGERGVVSVAALAAAMQDAVWPSPRPAGTAFTAAELALEMVEGVQVAAFEREQPVMTASAWQY